MRTPLHCSHPTHARRRRVAIPRQHELQGLQGLRRDDFVRGALALGFATTLLALLLVTVGAAHAAPLPPALERLERRLAADGFGDPHVAELLRRAATEFDTQPMVLKMRELYSHKYGTRLMRAVQTELDRLGYNPGPADGFWGPNTRRAVLLFRMAHDMKASTRVDAAFLERLKAETAPMPPGLRLPPKEKGPSVYRTIMTPERLAEAKAFYHEHLPLLSRMRAAYGVPETVAVGIVTVETRGGRYLGEQSAFLTLAGMAASRELEDIAPLMREESPSAEAQRWLLSRMRDKSDWAYRELKALLKHARRDKLDPMAMPGSIYGAVGIVQFMPSNILHYGVDGDGDGVVNLFTTEDALMSLGHFVSRHGWRSGPDNRTAQRKALFRYNQSTTYVNTVLAVADHVRDAVAMQAP